MRTEVAVRIGISSCLLGQEVRFDGGHKRDRFLTDTFGQFVEWVPVCPEVEAGFGTPREPMRLVDSNGRLRLITVRTQQDVTDRLAGYAARRVEELTREDLCGYVLKKDSPSCGVERVKVYERATTVRRNGTGLFAAALRGQLPCLPLEDEGRLADPRLRENFIERVFAYRRVRDLFGHRWTAGELVTFHTAHKLTLMAHSTTAAYQTLGRLVANSKRLSRVELEAEYVEGFMTALGQIATARRHANVLQHMAGYFKSSLSAAEKRELVETIADYRTGLVPLIVPITLIRHHVRRHDISYLAGQVYLEPHPKELMLRNHV